MNTSRPVTVSIVSPLTTVSRGLTSMLAGRPEVEVVDRQGPVAGHPEVVLYDAVALVDGTAGLDRLLAGPSTVLAVGHHLRPGLGAVALRQGAHGVVDLSVDAHTLLDHVLASVGRQPAGPHPVADVAPQRLGGSAGLTPREVDVLSKITQGLSNQEIAEQSYLSINSVKTYIRSAYRRIGATSRSQAVVWCVQHGFASSVAA